MHGGLTSRSREAEAVDNRIALTPSRETHKRHGAPHISIGAADDISRQVSAGLASLFIVEMWERFSYYGMRAILVLFMIDAMQTGGLGMADGGGRGDLRPLHGLGLHPRSARRLDRRPLLGRQRAILVGGVVIMVGHILLAVAGSSAGSSTWARRIAVGTGLLKPNISTMVGMLYDKNDIARPRRRLLVLLHGHQRRRDPRRR